jgi:hypothetical protein
MKREGKGYEVFEAENKVKRGVDQKYVVKRLKKSLSSQQIAAMKTNIVLKWVGKPYDKYFDWNHGSLYCSELVWVVFADPKINIRLSELRRLDSFNVTNVGVHNLLVKRYKNKIPFAMEVVAPADIFNSPQLIEVYKN